MRSKKRKSKKKRKDTPLAERNLSYNLLFPIVMSDPELSRLLLQKVLWFPIGKVKRVQTEKRVQCSPDLKSVIYDVYGEDDENTVFAIEMQIRDYKDTIERGEFYSLTLGSGLLSRGDEYISLGSSVLLFICCYDPFDKGLYQYTMRKRSEEDRDVATNAGAYEIYLNTRGTHGDIDPELKEFLYYVEHTTDEVAAACTGELVEKVHERVKAIRDGKISKEEIMGIDEKIKIAAEELARELAEEMAEEMAEKKNVETAMRMLRNHCTYDIISSVTDFSVEEIEEIKRVMSVSVP